MGFWTSPQALRLRGGIANSSGLADMASSFAFSPNFNSLSPAAMQSEHPDFGHLVLLVFEAVLEVVCVSLPGYIVARMGLFSAEQQKFVANLNLQLFTPCLIFTKLASQLSAEKMVELAIIPLIFVVQIAISYTSAAVMSRIFGFGKQARNFVTAMAVFGNSNSLPISLVLSLSQTLNGLHWDRIPGDNDDEVSSRGILYLMIFQQLGQLLRWSWGYQILLAPPESYQNDEDRSDSPLPNRRLEEGRYHNLAGDPARERLLEGYSDDENSGSETVTRNQSRDDLLNSSTPHSPYELGGSSGATPLNASSTTVSEASTNANGHASKQNLQSSTGSKSPNGVRKIRHRLGPSRGDSRYITSFPESPHEGGEPPGIKGKLLRIQRTASDRTFRAKGVMEDAAGKVFSSLPKPLQSVLSKIYALIARFLGGLWEFMNPPLWAMLAAVLVASIPYLQRVFFTPGTFINNSVTHAVQQNAGVAVPLILVVLGANLARSTPPPEECSEDEDPKQDRNLLIASLLSRMLFPTIIMTPLLALTAKFVPVSILDDPIFVVVCFLLTGAPSALQLAQICQLNNVYLGAVSKLLFQSYVIWILPSTLILVMLALEVVYWAAD
jgi:predicted permease